MLGNILRRLKSGTEHLNYGRDIIATMAQKHLKHGQDTARVLDIGFGSGTDLLNIRQSIKGREVILYGVDGYEPHVQQGASKKINTCLLDIESERLPFEDQFFDIVVANQVIEHTKDIFWIFSEISRVIKPGGCVIIGVPNLASLHCRVQLLIGEQPSCIEVLGPHVRGVTKKSFERFVTADGYYQVIEQRGSNFYPFPPAIAKVLSRLLPGFAVSLIICIQRTDKPGKFIDILKTRFFETNFRTAEKTS